MFFDRFYDLFFEVKQIRAKAPPDYESAHRRIIQSTAELYKATPVRVCTESFVFARIHRMRCGMALHSQHGACNTQDVLASMVASLTGVPQR
jgi:hypothetical protein